MGRGSDGDAPRARTGAPLRPDAVAPRGRRADGLSTWPAAPSYVVDALAQEGPCLDVQLGQGALGYRWMGQGYQPRLARVACIGPAQATVARATFLHVQVWLQPRAAAPTPWRPATRMPLAIARRANTARRSLSGDAELSAEKHPKRPGTAKGEDPRKPRSVPLFSCRHCSARHACCVPALLGCPACLRRCRRRRCLLRC
jgi:hypothetical protein